MFKNFNIFFTLFLEKKIAALLMTETANIVKAVTVVLNRKLKTLWRMYNNLVKVKTFNNNSILRLLHTEAKLTTF